ncbi:MAG: hypothetical protein OXF88_14345 [Rhodobacteraceae bacterium]|nr:hypothetical protein [Paracoccaceae bacterium]
MVKSIGDVTKNALATFVGLLTTAVLAACAIAPAAVQAEEMASQDFLNYIEWEIFREDPFTTDHLEEFKTGHWSWNITPIIYDYSRHLESGGTLAEVIEKSFPLLVELTRHRESDGPMTERAYRGNRYHLDPDDTDFKRVFKRYYKENLLMLFSRYRLVIYLYTKRGDTSETVEAYLFFDSL